MDKSVSPLNPDRLQTRRSTDTLSNLMAPDEFRNLGFKDDDNRINVNSAPNATKPNNVTDTSTIQDDSVGRGRPNPS